MFQFKGTFARQGSYVFCCILVVAATKTEYNVLNKIDMLALQTAVEGHFPYSSFPTSSSVLLFSLLEENGQNSIDMLTG